MAEMVARLFRCPHVLSVTCAEQEQDRCRRSLYLNHTKSSFSAQDCSGLS